MKHLIIIAHPNNESSFNQAILKNTVAASEKAGAEIIVRDLYQLEFNPILSLAELSSSKGGETPADIKYEQELLDQADLITMIYPLWWMGFPAILKGYLDRILSHGFAYKTVDGRSVGLLHGKKMQQFITVGSSERKYRELGFNQSLQDCLVDGLFNFCGISDIDHHLFTDIHTINDAARQEMLDVVASKTQANLAALASKE